MLPDWLGHLGWQSMGGLDLRRWGAQLNPPLFAANHRLWIVLDPLCLGTYFPFAV